MSTSRLTPDAWLTAGFEALQAQGPQALAAEPLARRLGTTKGSFYWHFKDVPAYHNALLAAWRNTALSEVDQLKAATDAADRQLRNFGRQRLEDPVEPGLRLWAGTDRHVAEVMRTVDAARLDYLVHLLRQLDLGNPDFARALQAALTGLRQSPQPDARAAQSAFDVLVDTVLALR